MEPQRAANAAPTEYYSLRWVSRHDGAGIEVMVDVELVHGHWVLTLCEKNLLGGFTPLAQEVYDDRHSAFMRAAAMMATELLRFAHKETE